MGVRLSMRLLLSVVLVAAVSAPVVADAATEPPPDRRAVIQVTVPNVAYVGQPYTIRGALLLYSGPWSGGAGVVHVSRTAGGVATPMPDVLTSPDGSFSFEDVHSQANVGVYYRLAWDGDADHDPVVVSRGVPIRLVPVTITLASTPSAPTALDEITITGRVTVPDGFAPMGPTTLSVRRLVSNGESRPPLSLLPVTTATDGTFAFTDRPHGGGWQYEVTHSSDGTYESRSKSIWVELRALQVATSVQLAPNQTVRWGEPAHYTGQVTALEGPAISTPMVIVVYGTGTCAPSPVQLTRFQSAADGSFTFDAMPVCVHDTTVNAVAWLDADYKGVAGPTVSSPVAIGGPATVRIDYGRSGAPAVIDWDSRSTFIQALVPWATGRTLVEVYAKPYGRAKVLVHRQWLNSGWDPGFIYSPNRRTVISAVYHGDEGMLPGSATSVMWVRPSMQGSVTGDFRTANGWTVFHVRHNPFFQAGMTPAHRGKALRLVVQRKVDGVWRTTVSRSVTQDRWGGIGTDYRGPRVAGARFRFRATWAGDADHVAAASPWRYFRFTT